MLAGVGKNRGADTILDNVSLTISPETRVGVVGPNGVGKTTLLRIAAGLEPPDAGSVKRSPPTLSVGYLPQERAVRPGETLLGYLARRTGVGDAARQLEESAAALSRGEAAEDGYSEALDRFLALGGDTLERRARRVSSELGLRIGLDRPLAGLSGGEAARAGLAGILLARFDVFLLDEPTNDLDFDGLARLERFLAGVRRGVAVVSHDRDFLDRTVTGILELDDHTRRAREFAGGWTEYETARARARERRSAEHADYEERRRELEALLRARRGQARAGASLGKQTGGADRRATRALSGKVRHAELALERLEQVEKPWQPWQLRLRLHADSRPGDVVVALERAVVERGDFRLGPLDVSIGRRDRVAIVGRNGSGKTTLLGALTGSMPLTAGRRQVGGGVVFGTLDQRRSALAGDEPLLRAFAGREAETRTLLAKFGLGADDVLRPGRTLSPGERSRAELAWLSARGVNCLVLDEPTNHLDLPAIEELERALADYAGTVLLVSHDRRFLAGFSATQRVEL